MATMVEVKALISPELMVEIEVTAVLANRVRRHQDQFPAASA